MEILIRNMQFFSSKQILWLAAILVLLTAGCSSADSPEPQQEPQQEPEPQVTQKARKIPLMYWFDAFFRTRNFNFKLDRGVGRYPLCAPISAILRAARSARKQSSVRFTLNHRYSFQLLFFLADSLGGEDLM